MSSKCGVQNSSKHHDCWAIHLLPATEFPRRLMLLKFQPIDHEQSVKGSNKTIAVRIGINTGLI